MVFGRGAGAAVEFPAVETPKRRSTQTTWITLLVPKDADRPLTTLQWWGHSPARRGNASGELAPAISNDVLSVADVLGLDSAGRAAGADPRDERPKAYAVAAPGCAERPGSGRGMGERVQPPYLFRSSR